MEPVLNIQVIDLESGNSNVRQMSSEEISVYNQILEESSIIINNEKNKARKKEEAIAKLVSLGLTEEDIRAVMS